MARHNGELSTSTTRRRLLAGIGATGAVSMAGCLGSIGDSAGAGGSGADGPTAVASFFTFYDFGRRIAEGTPLTVENLVPVGLHGHGWEPDPSITRDIIDADAFLHVGPDFQPWADRAIQTVHDDDAGTHLVNVREGIDLIDLADTVEDDEQVSDGKDPHFWLDPTLAQQSVENIADGFTDIAPDHEDAFRENAATITDDLDALDEEWQSIFDAAERDVVFLSAHNAFEYVGQRYGATIQPLITNLAASDDVRPADMRRARETIDENDIRYIGAAIFESRRPAQQLVEDTRVEAYYPVTPYAGITEEWDEAGWGYFDIARQINMETFRIVLGVAEPEEASLGSDWRNFE